AAGAARADRLAQPVARWPLFHRGDAASALLLPGHLEPVPVPHGDLGSSGPRGPAAAGPSPGRSAVVGPGLGSTGTAELALAGRRAGNPGLDRGARWWRS